MPSSEKNNKITLWNIIYKHIRLFHKNTQGVSTIQFAILGPIFILLLIASLQIGIVQVINNALEGAAREASRLAIVDATEDKTDAIRAKVSTVAKNLSGGIINKNKVIINIKSYDNIEDLGRPEPFIDTNADGEYTEGEAYEDKNGNNQWDADRGISDSFGLGGNAVVYEIKYIWDTIIPIFNFDRYVNITARTIVVNEDFSEGGS